jgi:hypothetical protein
VRGPVAEISARLGFVGAVANALAVYREAVEAQRSIE